MFKKKIFVYESEGFKSSVGQDYLNTVKLINDIENCQTVSNPFSCDIIYFPWWNKAEKFRHILKLSNKKVIVVLTNEIANNMKSFYKLKEVVDLWVCANKTQEKFIKNQGLNYYYHPFYIDESIFKKLSLSKKEILKLFNIEKNIPKHKKIIFSAQRDSLGKNLNKPKWQKGPQKLLEIIKQLPAESVHLLLAGARRHWLMKKLEESQIEFTYIGKRVNRDDLMINNISLEKMNLLYNLADYYIASSESEGGPKAIVEAMLCKTMIISTDVGLAKDFLPKELIYSSSSDAVTLIKSFLVNKKKEKEIILNNFNRASKLNNFDAAKNRMTDILNFF